MGDGTRREKETRRSEQSRKMTSDETEGRSLVGSFHLSIPILPTPFGRESEVNERKETGNP